MSQQQHQSRDERIFSIRVMEFSRENCPFSNRDHTWKQFHTFRNAVLDILSPYGTVGPIGKMPILDTYEESTEEWRGGHDHPDFFVVDDDMYGLSVRGGSVLDSRQASSLRRTGDVPDTVPGMVCVFCSYKGRLVHIP